MSLTYVSQSTIPNSGKGLFARKTIKKGTVIAEFKGKILRKVDDESEDSNSMVDFQDGFVLVCDETDVAASFANDFVQFPTTRRKLMESLRSNTPFYSIHPNATRNSNIDLDTANHRAFLVASTKIRCGKEIFTHYGFNYWFLKEISTLGFLEEQEIKENGFPETLHQYPGFLSYLKLVHPDHVKIISKIAADQSGVLICLADGSKKIYTGMTNRTPYKRWGDHMRN